MLSKLALAELDGVRLSDAELGVFCLTLLVAGNETTRNLISGGMHALLADRAQWEKLCADPSLLPNAIEEMLRYVSPIQNFVRRVQHDTELAGKQLRAGEYVALLYGSANRDEAVFGADADRFDIMRPNADRHLAFGFGEHLCLGASLARLEARVMFEELIARGPGFSPAGPARKLPSTLVNGIVEMPVVFEERAMSAWPGRAALRRSCARGRASGSAPPRGSGSSRPRSPNSGGSASGARTSPRSRGPRASRDRASTRTSPPSTTCSSSSPGASRSRSCAASTAPSACARRSTAWPTP